MHTHTNTHTYVSDKNNSCFLRNQAHAGLQHTPDLKNDYSVGSGNSDFHALQPSQTVTFQPGGSVYVTVNFTVTDDDVVECEETFGLSLVSIDPKRLQIDPTRDEAVVSIIDDDGMVFSFLI